MVSGGHFSTILKIFFSYTLLLAYCGFIFFLSSKTTSAPALFPHSDKVFHLVEYSILGLLVLNALTTFGFHDQFKAAMWMAWIFCALYGLSDEFHQSFVPGREASLLDLATDTIGGMLGTWLFITFLDKPRPKVVS